MDYVITYQEEPGSNGTQNNLQYGYCGNDFSVRAVNSQILTPPWGIATYEPNFASVIEEVGHIRLMITSTRAQPLDLLRSPLHWNKPRKRIPHLMYFWWGIPV